MKRRVIIPAAGEAVRFGGVPKEMLPISEEETLLGRAVRMARRIGDPVIITNRKKEHLHRRLAPDVEMIVKEDPKHLDLWGSILLGLKHGVPGGLILPDTVTDFDPSTIPADMPIGFGTFQTYTPERFSCLTQGRIATKEYGAAVPALAWGVVVWSGLVSEAFLGGAFKTYDPVFQMVMRTMGYGTFPLHYYHDLGTFVAYREFLLSQRIKGPHPLMDCPQCGEFCAHGHECKPNLAKDKSSLSI